MISKEKIIEASNKPDPKITLPDIPDYSLFFDDEP